MTSREAPACTDRRRAPRSWLLGALCLCGTGALACGSGSAANDDWGQLRSALSGATLDSGYTGALALVTVTRAQIELCTATLLAPNLVATARHCVAPTSADSVVCSADPGAFSAPYAADNLWVNHASELSGPLQSFGLLSIRGGSEEFVPVAGVYVPDTEHVCGGDLALLLLDAELDGGQAAPFAPRLDLPVKVGEPYTAIGFGDDPSPSGQGVRRARSGLEVDCTPESCAPSNGVEPTEFRGGDGVCSGDSGGPALDAEGRVIGIASRSDSCTSSVYSAVAAWRDFIRLVAVRAVNAGSYPEPDWLAAPPPEPESAAPEPAPEPPAAPGAEAAVAAAPSLAGTNAPDEASDIALNPVGTDASGGSGCDLHGIPRPASPLAPLGIALGAFALQRRRTFRRPRRS